MPKVSFGAPEPEPEPEVAKSTTGKGKAKKVTAQKYGPNNVHPDKGTYLKLPLTNIVLDGNAYLGVASTGQLGITNIKFDFTINLGDGDEIVTYHSGWGNMLRQRDAQFIKDNALLGKKSGVKVDEIPEYEIDAKGKSNITDLLGPLKKSNSATE